MKLAGAGPEVATSRARPGSAGEVFFAFLKLGLTSFGGPIAHLGYFRDEFVVRRKWIDEQGYADLVALCQFLPGPASSQVGFSLGLLRGGPLGALAAWTAFTLPSALLLLLLAYGAAGFDTPIGNSVLHGLKLVAVAVVAQAVWGMARALTPDRERAAIALGAVFAVILAAGPAGQVAAILMGAVAGLWLCRDLPVAGAPVSGFRVSRTVGMVALRVFFLLLVGLPAMTWAWPDPTFELVDAFYRSGALVFGGGHVVLPLLEAEVVQSGWVSADSFLAGYGLAQAMPGPLFTVAAYLGAVMSTPPTGLAGAALALVAIFLPGLLLVVGILPFWDKFRTLPYAQAAMRGANAAVVGVLAAALYSPVWTSAVLRPVDFALVVAGLLLLTVWRLPPWIVVIGLGIAGTLTMQT